jgi:NADP-dependent 3-hydroxy acid dehydrogenase YdfG
MVKVIVIMGASAGIGAALAKKLGAAGHSLCLGARRERELKEAAAAAGPSAVAVVMDATRRAEVERLRDAALKSFGRVDVWVNNAGRGINRSVQQLSDDDFDQMMAVNVKSAIYGLQAILPHFKERGSGHVINVSSFLGRVPFVTARSAYNAAKHALNALTANLRVELRATHPGIKVSLVMPGVVTTDFAKNAMGDPPQPIRGGMMKPQNAEEVAEVMADLIEHPVAEVYTNPALRDLAVQYIQDVGAFEERAAAGGGGGKS